MADVAPAPTTVDAFLAWAADQPGRYELEDGRAVAVAPERLGHVLAKTGSFDALAAAVAAAGLPCRALPDGAAVRIDARTLYEPDALVFCGDSPARDARAIVAPVIVVEVVSPGTGRRDHHEKLIGYSSVPGIEHYLIVYAETRVLVHHARRGGEIATHILHGGLLRLDPPGLDLAVEDLFGGPA
ncbi:Uma2 family endonuclease [Lichenibacterium dinghuense]|uniref:Uma2 family endonuclease n=1 Tax=Lichenibacterium dinghuense TaxID=2895977 RepID=UPI001F2D9BC3|nr:Uma2 family endonuclease [Lichenibacterium sp. 6Y81]